MFILKTIYPSIDASRLCRCCRHGVKKLELSALSKMDRVGRGTWDHESRFRTRQYLDGLDELFER
jgi:hypothetical protein